jgi:hypothetical protein
MFLAVALGVKPCYDDWISVKKYYNFIDVCDSYDLVVEPDVIFTNPLNDIKKINGGKNITTTFKEGKRFNKEEIDGNVHIFVSKTKEKAQEAKRVGWYPIVINNRLINKPFIDHLRFGKQLGFPDCCVDFFRRFNNWHLYSHPYETFKNTKITNKNNSIGSYYCNNFLMDHTYFLIHNLPCSYRCQKTICLAKKIENKIKEVEPEYVKKTKELLKKPLLVFGERHFVIFNGKLSNDKNILKYDNCQYIKNTARLESSMDLFDSLSQGNKIIVNNNKIMIKDNNSILKIIEKKPEWFVIDFD